MKRIFYIINLLFFITLAGCGNHSTTKPSATIYTVHTTAQDVKNLAYQGIIQPISIESVTTPTDGAVEKIYFKYGDILHKGQMLLEVNSEQLDKNYQSVVASYLTAKDKYDTAQQQMTGTEDLYRSGIISKNEYDQQKSSLEDAYLSYIQSKHNLEAMLTAQNIPLAKIENLKINELKQIAEILEKPFSAMKIAAHKDGIALFPLKSSGSSNDSDNQELTIGKAVKSGDALLAIGDMSGIKVNIKIDEININDIQIGQKAVITSEAFPDTLHGVVSEVAQQASSDESSGLPLFPVTIMVTKIPDKVRKELRVGMSVKVNLTLQKKQTIEIPINAVYQKDGNSYVDKLDPKTKKTVATKITTGKTSLNNVEVLTGLQEGDQIVISH